MTTNTTLCPVCGYSSDFVFTVPFRNGKINLDGSDFSPTIDYRHCSECGLYFSETQRNWGTSEFKEHVYNEAYAKYDSDIINEHGNRPTCMYNLMHTMFNYYLCSGAYILDYGCGNGFWIDRLRKDGFSRVYGYDPYYSVNAEPLRDKYELITCTEVIEHDYNIVETFKKFSNMLYLGGAVLLSTDVTDDMMGVKTNYYTCPRVGHVMLYSKKTLRCIAEKCGFSIIHLGKISCMQFHLFIKQH